MALAVHPADVGLYAVLIGLLSSLAQSANGMSSTQRTLVYTKQTLLLLLHIQWYYYYIWQLQHNKAHMKFSLLIQCM